jgi:hypothetical protein
MRKLFLAIAILAIVAVSSSIIFYACQKESEGVNQQMTNSSEQLKFQKEVGGGTICISWKGGSKKRGDCGNSEKGMCDFKITVATDKYGIWDDFATVFTGIAPINTDEEGNLSFNVLANEKSFDDGSMFLIDETLVTVTDNGDKYQIKEGIYPLQKELGPLGGWTIPIIKL